MKFFEISPKEEGAFPGSFLEVQKGKKTIWVSQTHIVFPPVSNPKLEKKEIKLDRFSTSQKKQIQKLAKALFFFQDPKIVQKLFSILKLDK